METDAGFLSASGCKDKNFKEYNPKNRPTFFSGRKIPQKGAPRKKTADQKVGQDIKHRAKLTASGKAGAKVDNLGIQSKYKGRKIERK